MEWKSQWISTASHISFHFELNVILIEQVNGYVDSVVKWITQCHLKQTVLGSSPRGNMNSAMQAHAVDESETGRNISSGFRF